MKLLFAATQFAGEGNLAAWRCANVPKGYKATVEVRGGVVEAVVRGRVLDDLGMLIDFKTVKGLLADVLDRFDHRYLNELAPFSEGIHPTAEHLARVIYEERAAREPLAEAKEGSVRQF